jgi:hypothetical protein
MSCPINVMLPLLMHPRISSVTLSQTQPRCVPSYEGPLVLDDGFASAVRLVLGAACGQNGLARDKRALELERHLCARQEALRQADVV